MNQAWVRFKKNKDDSPGRNDTLVFGQIKKILGLDEKPVRKEIPKIILIQVITLDVMQIMFVTLGVMILGREICWDDSLDTVILWKFFVLAIVFLIFHLCVNGVSIYKSIRTWKSAPVYSVSEDEAKK